MSNETPQPAAKKRPDPNLRLILFQAAVCLLAVAAVFAVKLVGGDLYANLRGWYEYRYEDSTDPWEVLDPAGGSSGSDSAVPGVSSDLSDSSDFVSKPQDGDRPDASSAPQPTESAPASADPGESEPSDAAQQVNAFDLNAVRTVRDTRLSAINTLRWPVNGVITSGFGDRTDPFGSGKTVHHYGLDVAANTGTPIGAAMDGVVSAVGYEENGYGNYLMLEHQGGFLTLYGHCSSIAVKKGQTVKAGQTVARVGATGAATGPHLHFEIRVGKQKINPAWILDLSAVS